MRQARRGRFHRLLACTGAIAALTIGLAAAPGVGRANDAADAKALIDQAEATLKNFMSDPDMKWFGNHLQQAKGVYIVPKLTKGAFIFGVEGGNGVVLARDEKGGWSEPVFYETSAASFGLQAGAQSQEAILLIMTAKAVDSLLANKIKLGADGSVAIGPKGEGADTNLTADFITFTRAKGLYAGVSFDGALIRARDELNAAYYGQDVRPSDIIIAQKVKPNANSKELHAMLGAAMGKQ
ncbi:MAG TPA: lipid-binding SYLF domain-containing protein [Nitrospira sp.]|nr:lipid-binding SYLF domain-containing protein [Nitrospira sp.]